MCMYVYVCVCMFSTHICVCVCIYIYACVYVYVCVVQKFTFLLEASPCRAKNYHTCIAPKHLNRPNTA